MQHYIKIQLKIYTIRLTFPAFLWVSPNDSSIKHPILGSLRDWGGNLEKNLAYNIERVDRLLEFCRKMIKYLVKGSSGLILDCPRLPQIGIAGFKIGERILSKEKEEFKVMK